MGIIISDKDKLIQDLYKKMTKVTDIYSTTHKVVHWGDVQAIVEKFFMDKNSDWLMAKTEPSNSEKPNNCDEPQTKLCRECDDYAGDGMYCASNHIVYDFSTSKGNCEPPTERSSDD